MKRGLTKSAMTHATMLRKYAGTWDVVSASPWCHVCGQRQANLSTADSSRESHLTRKESGARECHLRPGTSRDDVVKEHATQNVAPSGRQSAASEEMACTSSGSRVMLKDQKPRIFTGVLFISSGNSSNGARSEPVELPFMLSRRCVSVHKSATSEKLICASTRLKCPLKTPRLQVLNTVHIIQLPAQCRPRSVSRTLRVEGLEEVQRRAESAHGAAASHGRGKVQRTDAQNKQSLHVMTNVQGTVVRRTTEDTWQDFVSLEGCRKCI